MNCAGCGKPCSIQCFAQEVFCNQECYSDYAVRLGGGLSGKTNFASRLEDFVMALVDLYSAQMAMKNPVQLNSVEKDLDTIGDRYIRAGNTYKAVRPRAIAIATMMNGVRLPGKLRGSKTAGEAVIAAINANLIKNWTLPLVSGGSVTADYFSALADAVSPFLNGDGRVSNVFMDISRALQAFVSGGNTSPAVISSQTKVLKKAVNASGAVLDEIYSDLIKSLKPEKK